MSRAFSRSEVLAAEDSCCDTENWDPATSCVSLSNFAYNVNCKAQWSTVTIPKKFLYLIKLFIHTAKISKVHNFLSLKLKDEFSVQTTGRKTCF